nr:unnamed protein product [Callosobruchus chinensis]
MGRLSHAISNHRTYE